MPMNLQLVFHGEIHVDRGGGGGGEEDEDEEEEEQSLQHRAIISMLITYDRVSTN